MTPGKDTRRVLAALLTACMAVPSTGNAQDVPIVPVSTELVQIDVVVTDKNGRAVAELTPEEFEVTEDGRPRVVSHLSYVVTGSVPRGAAPPAPDSPREAAPAAALAESRAPRTIAIVVDDLNLSSESMGRARRQIREFLDKHVQPGDRVALLRTGAGLTALQGFTADHRKLAQAVERLRWNPLSGRLHSVETIEEGALDQLLRAARSPVPNPAAAENKREELLARASLASLKTIVEALRRVPGRKALVAVSDGLKLSAEKGLGAPSEVATGLAALSAAANEGSVVVYAIDGRGGPPLAFSAADDFSRSTFAGGQTLPIFGREGQAALDARVVGFRGAQEALRALAVDTGGFLVHDSDLGRGLERVYGDQAGYYLLGFVPDEARGGGRFRKVEVRVRRPGLVVRARSRYWDGPTRLAPPPETNIEQFVAAFKDPFDSNDVPLRMMPLVGRDASGVFFVRALVHVDANALTLVERGAGRYEAEIEVVGLARRDDGSSEAESDMIHTIRAEGLEGVERLRRNGAVLVVTVTLAKPGFQQIRVAVRDTATARIGWASEVVEIPDLRKRKLALSGLVLGEEGIDPLRSGAVRRFRAGSELRANFIVFGAKPDATSKGPPPLVEWRLTREGAEPAGQGSLPLTIVANRGVAKGLPGEARLVIPPDVPADDYALEIAVKGLEKSPLRQWADITIENAGAAGTAPSP